MLTITPIPAFHDNYIWLLRLTGTDRVVVVDPGDAAPVLAALQEQQLRLEAILITHHHNDHVGGIDALLSYAAVPVYGPANPAIKQITHRLKDHDRITVLDTRFDILEVPGHTLDHIAYITRDTPKPLLFCGDTLFSAGCGRLFEGSAEQMHHSLAKLARLPGDSLVFPTHEYTLANLAFAKQVEPDNCALISYDNWCQQQRSAALPTLPTSINNELAINPFLRSQQSSVKHSVEAYCGEVLPQPVDVFRHTRLWKDHF